MDYQLCDGIFIIYVKDVLPLAVAVLSHSGLYGDLYNICVKYLVEKSVQLICIIKLSRAPVLAHHCTGRASKIKIYLIIAIALKKSRCLEKCLTVICQKLRYHIHAIVILRENVLKLPASQRSAYSRNYKGSKIFVHSGKISVVCSSVYIACYALHRCHVYTHFVSPYMSLNRAKGSLRKIE